MMEDYKDIMYLDRPAPTHPRMNLGDRAKIFVPFAALKGYEEALEVVLQKARDEVAGEIQKEQIEDI